MKIQEIEAFLAVVKYGSFTKAAEKTFTTQPTISWQISSLEREVGHTLLVRGKGIHQITLTEAGKIFYPQAVKWAQLWSETEELLSMQNTDHYRVGCTPSLAERLFPVLHTKFRQELPDCVLNLVSRTSLGVFDLVERGNMDCGIVAEIQPSSTVSVVPLVREQQVFVCRKDARYGDAVTLAELDGGEQIFSNWTTEDEAWRKHWFGSQTRPYFVVSNPRNPSAFFTIPDAWSTIPKSLLADFPSDFRTCTLDTAPPNRVLYLISKYPQREPYYRLVRDALTAHFRRIDGMELLVAEK